MTPRAESRTEAQWGREPRGRKRLAFLLSACSVGGGRPGRAAARERDSAAPEAPPAQELAEIGVRLIDQAYMAWFSAASDCERAMRAWRHGTAGRDVDAYWAYRAALDREEAAARDLKRLSELARPCRDALGRRRSQAACPS